MLLDQFGQWHVFYEVAALLALATVLGLVGFLLRQPLIVAFIATGLLAGPDLLGIVHATEHIELLAEIGIAVLLFVVGLKLDIGLIRTIGPVAVATGLGQVIFTSLFGFFICIGLGLDVVTSIYVAVALTFSSTIIIVKLLSDKGEIESLHGRIALGFLIVQDIAVIAAMVALSGLGVGAADGPGTPGLLGAILSGVLLLGFVALFMRYGAEPLLRRLAGIPELLLTFSIAWAVVLASVSDFLGFGKELGGLLAGVSLASTPYREAVASRLTTLRDFLLLFFFIGLGARLDLSVLGAQVPAAVILSLFVLIGNPLIVLMIMGYMGYRKRTGFLAGLTVAQISEFSLIFMAMGLALGHVGDEAIGLVTLVGLVTITLSTYMIVYSHRLYAVVEGLLGIFERRVPFREPDAETPHMGAGCDVILFGLGRYGREIAIRLQERERRVLGVDFDPEAIRRWKLRGLPAVYGDAADPGFAASLPLRGAAWVVCAIPPRPSGISTEDVRLVLMQSIRGTGFKGRFAVTSFDPVDAKHMFEAGADLVLTPFSDAALTAVERIVQTDGGEQERAAAAQISKTHP